MTDFFNINSVAVVGASEKEGKIGNILIKNLNYFDGEKFGINPKGGKVGKITFIKTISDLPIVPDILVFAIPARYVLRELELAGLKGIRRVIVISAGFKEIGNIDLENKLVEIAGRFEIQLLGPNCLGYVDTFKKLDLSFGAKQFDFCKGNECQNIAMISQSGAMAVAITDWAVSKKIGFSRMISLGNKAGLSESDFLEELEKDEYTKVIALYLESIEDGERFFKITQRLSKKYPIILVKSGISKKGSLAASSHTGALASQKDIQHSAFSHAGIHYTQSLEDFFLWGQIFSKTEVLKVPKDLVIITNAGGPGVMATDHCETYGVKLANFTDEEKKILKRLLPKESSLNNPIDIVGDADSNRFKQILNNLLKLSKKRAILIMLTAQSVTDVENIAKVIVEFKENNPEEFIMVSFMGGKGVFGGREILKKAKILEYDYPRKAIMSYSRVILQQKWQKTTIKRIEGFEYPENFEELKQRLKLETKFCSNELTGEILRSFDINHQREIVTKKEKEVKKACKELKTDLFVARISSPDIPHKSDVGGVILDIEGIRGAKKAYNKILKNVGKKAPNANINGVVIAKMIKKTNLTRNVFVGFKRDDSFGNILIIGMGGIFVNVFEDVSRRIGIIGKKEIFNMFTELKTFPILKGTRGQASIDFNKLIDIIFKLQFIFDKLTQIKEIDINPIFSTPEDSIVIDAKFYL